MSGSIVVAGSGGHAKVVIEACRAGGAVVAGCIRDRAADGELFHGVEVLGDERLLRDTEFLAAHAVVAARGDRALRRRLSETVLANGGRLATVIHPAAIVSPTATIAAGSVVLAGAILGPDAQVGRFCIVNHGASLDHDGRIEDGVNLCPGARLAGAVLCREDAFVGIGAAIIQGVTIGRRAIVGAGATVTADVEDDATVVGCPARRVR
jgi:acetyltransferase EpsM